MSIILRFFALALFFSIVYGFIVRHGSPEKGDIIIGICVLASVFIFMPLFLLHRWKGKKLKDYTLSPENMEKMKQTLYEKKNKRR